MDPTEFGHYRLLVLLGRGGMGEVWRARNTRTDREVALKIVRADRHGDEYVHRFRRESAHAARLNHPNIIPIHDHGEIDGQLYLEMALIEGIDLATLIGRGPIPPERSIEIIAQVAKALDVAHQCKLVHRDVKPTNILIRDNGGDDHAYLIDFGIALAPEDTQITQIGYAIGSPPYMAPERFTGQGDYRSDLYALGCVLYETLTGHQPFRASGPRNAHQDIAPPRPSASRADLPRALDAVTTKAMAKDPQQRFNTGAALAAAARAALTQGHSPGRLSQGGAPGRAPTLRHDQPLSAWSIALAIYGYAAAVIFVLCPIWGTAYFVWQLIWNVSTTPTVSDNPFVTCGVFSERCHSMFSATPEFDRNSDAFARPPPFFTVIEIIIASIAAIATILTIVAILATRPQRKRFA